MKLKWKINVFKKSTTRQRAFVILDFSSSLTANIPILWVVQKAELSDKWIFSLASCSPFSSSLLAQTDHTDTDIKDDIGDDKIRCCVCFLTI